MARGPRVAGGKPQICHQWLVRVVPAGTLPRCTIEERGAQFALLMGEGAPTQPARRCVTFRGVVNRVDIAIGVLAAGAIDLRIQLHVMEPREIGRRAIDRRGPTNQGLRKGPCHARRVRHPHRLCHPEALQLGVFPHQRVSIGRECEYTVEALLQLGNTQSRHQLAR